MSMLSELVAHALEWTGWLWNGWCWLFSPAFREQKQESWRDLPSGIVVLDAAASFLFWIGEITFLFWLLYLALWT